MKPTEEQIKEFWEWCGLEILEEYSDAFKCAVFLTKDSHGFATPLPPIDLNNLFKYAVPALNEKIDRHIDLYQSTGGWTCNIGLGDFTYEDKDPALALFWAIYKVIRGEK